MNCFRITRQYVFIDLAGIPCCWPHLPASASLQTSCPPTSATRLSFVISAWPRGFAAHYWKDRWEVDGYAAYCSWCCSSNVQRPFTSKPPRSTLSMEPCSDIYVRYLQPTEKLSTTQSMEYYRRRGQVAATTSRNNGYFSKSCLLFGPSGERRRI